jgi:oligosaccharide repeat unit polymerase
MFGIFRGTGFNILTAISPVGMVAVAFLFLIGSTFVSPESYQVVLKEPNLMHMNWKLIGFISLTCAAFLAGFFLIGGNSGNNRLLRSGSADGNTNKLYHVFPLLVAAALNVYSVMIMMKNTPGLLGYVLSANGNTVKEVIDTSGGLAGAQPLLIAMIWWAMGKHMVVFPNLKTTGAKVSAALIVGGLSLAVLISILKVARYEVIPLLVGSLIVYLVMSARRGTMDAKKLMTIGVACVAGVVAIFIAFSFLRGNTSQGVEQNLYGYGPTAVNHLSAVIDGRLRFPYAGTGTYTFEFLSRAPFIYKFINFQALLGLPDPVMVFESEFSATREAGLNASYNWVTAFGYYYMDLGPWYYPFFVLMGALSCVFWKQALKGQTLGLVMYPFMAGTILLWMTSNAFTRAQLMTYMMMVVALIIYDQLFSRRQRNPLQESLAARAQVNPSPRPQMDVRRPAMRPQLRPRPQPNRPETRR